jgi:hypothetical protein
MTDQDYPQEISPDEARVGFRRLLIDGIGSLMGSMINPTPVPVVATILSSSDILIKICDPFGNVVYSHRRWGRPKDGIGMDEWIPVFNPVADWQQFLRDYNAGTHPEMFTDRIQSKAFRYRKID